MPNSVTGGSAPAYSANCILNEIYLKKTPENLSERGVKKLFIDKKAYEDKGEFLIAAEGTKEKDKLYFSFTEKNYPKAVAKTAEKLKLNDVTLSVFGDTVIIPIVAEKGVMVEIKKTIGKKTEVVYDGPPTIFTDETGGDVTYSITPYKTENDKKIYGETLEKKVKKDRKKSDFKPDNWWND